MRSRTISTLLRAAVVMAPAALSILPAAAQVAQPSRSNPEPHLPPGPSSIVGSSDIIATSAANAAGAYLWIVGPREHIVVLCEKKDTANDFNCTSKRLP